jgi:hypothetical protein
MNDIPPASNIGVPDAKRSSDMSFSLYDAVVPDKLQILGAIDRLLEKAKLFCAERGLPEAEMIDARLAPDMLPLGYQVKSCVVHSINAIEGARTGSFSPDWSAWPTDFERLHGMLQRASAELHALDRSTVDRLTGTAMNIVIGEGKLPFSGASFLLSFSQPNFYFHATTAYAILRAQGVNLGKRDFLGVLRANV